MFGPVRGRWKDGCRCGLRGWPPDGGAQRVFRERAAVECRAPAAEADVRHLRGAAVGWRTEGSGRCVVGAGRVLKCRASGVVPRTGGAGSSGSRAGVGPVRAGADRWARRGPAWTLCSGEAGMEPLPFPNGAGRIPRTEPLFRRGASLPAGPASGRCGPLGATRVGVDPLFRRGRHGAAAVSGRAGRFPRTQGLPSSRAAPSGRGPMLRFRTLFVLFCSVPPRRNRRRLQIRGFAAREKRKSCFFIFTL